MANLNIPFVLFQPQICSFTPSISTSKLIPFSKYCQLQKHHPVGVEVMKQNHSLKQIFGQSKQEQVNNSFNEKAKYNSLDDSQKNLLVMCDKDSGIICLFHQDQFISQKKEIIQGTNVSIKRDNKFIINMHPRVIMIPSISQESGPVIDYTLIKSPAKNILCSSAYFLTTLHQDNRIRLWNTDDGRCIQSSPQDLLQNKGIKIKKFKQHPGHVLILDELGNILILNVYTMIIQTQVKSEFKGCVNCLFKNNYFILCDQTGKIFVWKDNSKASPVKNQNQNSTLMLEMCNNEDQETLKFDLEEIVGGDDDFLDGRMILSFYFASQDQIIVVSSDKIELLMNRSRKTLEKFNSEDWLIYAKFFVTDEREMIMCINKQGYLLLYDVVELKHEQINHNSLLKINLFSNCKIYDDIRTESTLLEDHQELRKQQLADYQLKVSQLFNNGQKCFKFQPNENLLYTIISGGSSKSNSSSSNSIMLTWSITSIIENINYSSQKYQPSLIPLYINQIQINQKQISNCLINFNPIILKNYYNAHQFQYFFSDETITDHTIYTSIDHPSLILGTNYGRIFIISMFQETEEKVFPVILVDSHHQSPITNLFVAYNSSRKPRGGATRLSFQAQQQLNQNNETGGHLISVSQDGTIAITNLNSGEMHRQIHNFIINERERRRVDQFMEERFKNKREKRRNSIQQYFSVNSFYYLVKAKSQKVFHNLTMDGNIKKIIEVKNLRELQDIIIPTDANSLESQIKRGQTPDKKNEPQIGEGGNQSASNSTNNMFGMGRNGSTAQQQILATLTEDMHSSITIPSYACIGKDGSTIVLLISNLTVETEMYMNSDRDVIGIYEEPNLQQIYLLSSLLNIFIFNRRSQTLIRKGDCKVAINILRIKETVDYLASRNECLSLQSKTSQSALFDYHNFSKFFGSKNILMGLGNHKTLDYLSISLNFPLSYNPTSIYRQKYSKNLFDILQAKQQILDFKNNNQANLDSVKSVLQFINDSFFTNNELYKSDFNKDQFEKQNGVIIMSTKNTFCNSKQQIIMINTKKMIEVMQQKSLRISSKFGKGLKASQFFSQQQDHQIGGNSFKEEQKQSSQNQFQRKDSSAQNRRSSKKDNPQNIYYNQQDSFASIKWPTRLLSLVHPFNLDENIDENLEQFFGLCLPFLDFRIGVQGSEESFSFVLTKEDEDFYFNRNSTAKVISLLRLSQIKKEEQNLQSISKQMMSHQKQSIEAFISNNNYADLQEPLGRFFNSEYWKISNYISTLIPSFFLSVFVAIIEHAQEDIKIIIQDWLYLLQRINQQKIGNGVNSISMSALSKILLKKNHNISSTARDVIMKPILYTLDKENLKLLMEEWQNLIMDTYKKLKKDSGIKQYYGGNMPHQNNGNLQTSQGMGGGQSSQNSMNNGVGGSFQGEVKGNQMSQLKSSSAGLSNQSTTSQISQNDRRLINRYFGELEIRGLINLSYYSLYYSNDMDQRIQYRVSKLTTILTREIVDKFSDNKKYIHLLTILLQLLSTWMKTQHGNQKNKQIIEEVIKLLLYIFNFYKNPLNKEAFITRVTAENFHLIRPTHSELYLKLTSAKALLEIGENFTHDFLQLISEQATTLTEGPEYQQNVLEILRFFINGYGENLEHHLIQLTQILLKCLDPNDLALRKNSHKIISIILSMMVKLFPMVAFHHESQRLAVGTHDGPIAIYDVRTSAKWKILEGHQGNVTCLAFDSKGNILCSYSSVDLTVRLWKVGNTGFFSTIMGGTGKCSKEKKLESLKNIMNPHQIILKNKQLSQAGKANVMGLGPSQNVFNNEENAGQNQGAKEGSSGTRINKCTIKFILPKEKDVELMREDGKTIEVKLVK